MNGKKIEKAWDNVRTFLENCTTANFETPDGIDLTGFSAGAEFGESPELANELLRQTQEVFGSGQKSPISYHYPSNIPSEQYKIEWTLPQNDLLKAMNYMVEGQPWPKYYFGPVELAISYNFKLLDRSTNIELPNQQFSSSILVWLGRSNLISPTIWFPFNEPGKEFWNYVESLEPLLPFKFERKYLRLVNSNRKGTANVFSKL